MVKLNKIIVLLTMAVVLSAADAFAQQTFIIKGRVMEAETKEPLIGASVRCGSTGTATDVDGNYELSMKEGSYDIECSYIGFENDRRRIMLSCDTILDFSLQSSTSELSEVVVLSRSVMDRLKNTQPGMERIDLDEMSKTPVLFGERDILKSLQLLPGVSAEGDGTGGFQDVYKRQGKHERCALRSEYNRLGELVGALTVGNALTGQRFSEFVGEHQVIVA